MRGKASTVLPFGLVLMCLGVAVLSAGCGSGSSSRYRFIQASIAVPNNVDLQVDGKSVQTGILFGQSATYHTSSSGSHKFELFATGTTSNPYLSASVSLGKGDTTVIAENPFASISLAPYTDDNTAPTTGNVKLRIIHASPSAQAIDVYVVAQGSGIAGVNPQLPALTYPNASNYLSISAGNYDVIMTVSGTQIVLGNLTGTYNLTSGQIRTLVVLDASTGGGPFQQLQLNDLN
jgi:hypothetical protein